jgi:ATP synthase I chain
MTLPGEDDGHGTAPGTDLVLRRVERTATGFCVGAAVVSLVGGRGRLDLALGVLAGGALAAVSYWAIRSGVDALLRAWQGRGVSWAGVLLRLAGRYALLGLIAYVMIARFRLHPIGLVTGASSLFVAAAVEAIRQAAAPAGTGERGGRSSPR